MAIDNILQQILSAVYGRDVRQAIHDGIEECYDEAHAMYEGTIVSSGTNTIGDCNEAIANKIYTITNTSTLNLPVSRAGTLLTYDGDISGSAGQVQLYVVPDGDSYIRTYWGTGSSIQWSEWRHINAKSIIESGASTINDFNDAVSNRIYTIVNTSTLNIPVARPGTLITFDGDSSTSSGKSQMYILPDGGTYFRSFWASTGSPQWSSWASYMEKNMSEAGINSISDCDDAISNRIYTITNTSTLNIPVSRPGTLITFDGDSSTDTGKLQCYVLADGCAYLRVFWSYGSSPTWSNWRLLSYDENEFSGIEAFERFGVIGDSFASGTLYANDSYVDHYNISWPQILARMSGNIAINYTKGGMSTHSFLNNTDYGMPKLLNDVSNNNKCGLYLLCLGINDSNEAYTPGGLNYLGTIDDIHQDYTLNPDTFYGNYGKIIQMIREATPKSRLAICNFKRIPGSTTSAGYDAFREAISNIASYYNIPLIKLDDDPFFNSYYYLNTMVGNHPTAPTYTGYAKGINRLISKAMIDYYGYFNIYDGTII